MSQVTCVHFIWATVAKTYDLSGGPEYLHISQSHHAANISLPPGACPDDVRPQRVMRLRILDRRLRSFGVKATVLMSSHY